MTGLGFKILGVVIVVMAAVVGALILHAATRLLGRRVAVVARITHYTRLPFRYLAASVAATAGIHAFEPHRGAWSIPGHVAALCVIGSAAWFVGALLFVLEESALPRLRTDVEDNRHVRAVRTQVMVLRRVTVAVVAILGVGAALMTFREVRLIGTSVLASAGVVAAVAAFATNALLSNVIAGLQIAFSGSLRLDDVVVVEKQWGRIEEITLTYVVVHIWDDRRLILPASYFTTQVFENWTHTESQLLGEVLLELDWDVDIEGIRAALRKLVADSPMWDGRVAVAQVVDAIGGNVTIRVLVSSHDAPTLWDLRCMVREGLVVWVRGHGGPPLTRAELRTEVPEVKLTREMVPSQNGPGERLFHETVPDTGGAHREGQYRREAARVDRVFSGDRESRARGEEFSGPDDIEPRDDAAHDTNLHDVEPESAKPDATKQDGAKPDATKPDGAKPDGDAASASDAKVDAEAHD